MAKACFLDQQAFDDVWSRIGEKYYRSGDFVYNAKLEKIREEQLDKHSKRVEAGRKGGQTPSNATSKSQAMLKQSPKQKPSNQSQSHIKSKNKIQNQKKTNTLEKKHEFFIQAGKRKFLDFVYLLENQYSDLVEAYGKELVDAAIGILDDWYTQKPKKFLEQVDHYKVMNQSKWPIDRARESRDKAKPPNRRKTIKEIAEGLG